jgi:hypothetical protein
LSEDMTVKRLVDELQLTIQPLISEQNGIFWIWIGNPRLWENLFVTWLLNLASCRWRTGGTRDERDSQQGMS